MFSFASTLEKLLIICNITSSKTEQKIRQILFIVFQLHKTTRALDYINCIFPFFLGQLSVRHTYYPFILKPFNPSKYYLLNATVNLFIFFKPSYRKQPEQHHEDDYHDFFRFYFRLQIFPLVL